MNGLAAKVVLLHAAATLAMTGLIWFVQMCHYPLLSQIGADSFGAYHSEYTRRTAIVIAPLMLTELACALWIVAVPRPASALAWAGLVLLAIIWASTFGLQVPLHERLSAGFDPSAHHRLVATNWIRTGAWTLRGILALLLVRLHGVGHA